MAGKTKESGGTGLVTNRKLSASQVRFLADETKLDIDTISRLKIGDVAEKLRDHLDPYWLFRRKVCGRVVQRDPLTGELRGVPGATVEVEDTDCSGWLRTIGEFAWLYPFPCTRETIATAVTDECGNFCVWIPRWLFEWVRRWRKQRICFPVQRPWLEDIVDIHYPPIPDPDPGVIDPPPDPILGLDPRIDHPTAARLERIRNDLNAGSPSAELASVLAAPLRIPAPAPPTELDLVGYKPHPDGPIDFGHAFGPFWRCHDVYVPVWQRIVDVPDITFKVTQKINGSDVVVYAEGHFEVRWNDTGSGDVVLEANELAVATDDCGGHDGIVCEDVAAIISASEMPLDQGAAPLYHDDATGYGVRVNRPSADGISPPSSLVQVADAESPIADTLTLRGCVHIDGAEYYRVMYDRGAGPEPVTGTSWAAVSASLGVIMVGPDGDGWIQIRDLIGGYEHLLMRWPTVAYPNTGYDVWLEVADAAKNQIQQSAGHRFVLDNSQPTFSQFDVGFRVGAVPSGPFAPLDLTSCPKIFRAGGQAIELEVRWRANAAHLRDAFVAMGGCGGTPPTATTAADTVRWYWQAAGATDSGLRTARFTIPSSAEAGCYSVTREAVSRAYNPGNPGFGPSADYWENARRRWDRRSWSISVVDS